MGYVDKKVAMQYLANSEKMFQTTKDRFLRNNKDTVEKITELVSAGDCEGLRSLVNSIRGVSLNIGSQILYDDSGELCSNLEQGKMDNYLIERYIHTFRTVYGELENLK